MSWLRSLANFVHGLDEAVERVSEVVREQVSPLVSEVAARLDDALEKTGRDLVVVSRERSGELDERWQRFMVERVDPLFGQSRTEHLDAMGGLQISKHEEILNRRIGHTALYLVAIVVGGAVAPASLYVIVPLSFTMALPAYEMAIQSVRKQKRVTYHVISALNVTAIWLGGLYTPAIAAALFFYMAEKLLVVTQDRSHKGIVEVFGNHPRSVWVLIDGVEVERPFEAIEPGDVVVVMAGGHMPVDGTIVDGIASIDQQMLTGEAQPVEKLVGDTVYASTLVLAGRVAVRVEKAGEETVAAKIGDVLNSTASYQLDLQSRGSKLAHDAALPTLVLSGLALGTVGPMGALAVLNSSFGVTVRISGPITMLNLLNIAADNAILLKDGRSLELLSEVDTVLFDKTGTLTISQPHVTTIHCVGAHDEQSLLRFAAAAEHRQSHPIAQAILAEAETRGLELPDIEQSRYEVGYGIRVELAEHTIQVGSDRYMTRSGITIPSAILEQRDLCERQGHSLVMVAVDDALAGAIELQPTIRPEAAAVLAALRERGLKLVVISGDQEEPTRRLAEALEIDRFFANVLPEGKAALVEQLQAEGRSVCFVGDGINDSIALKRANVSVSLRGATTVATDTAQVVLMQESLEKLPMLFGFADDMERALKAGNTAGMVPGVINVAGVFLAGWGYYHALALNIISMSTAMGIAVYPRFKYATPAAESPARERELERPPSEARDVEPDSKVIIENAPSAGACAGAAPAPTS